MKTNRVLKAVFLYLSLFVFLLTSLAVAATVQKKTIHLVSPNGGEKLKIGSEYTIRWQSKGLKGSLNISLMYKNRNLGFLARNVNASRGAYTWKVGQVLKSRVKPSGGYTIRIYSGSQKVQDQSDRYFSIIPGSRKTLTTVVKPLTPVKKSITKAPVKKTDKIQKKSIRLLSPNGRESLKAGSEYQIRWSARGIRGNVTLYLSQQGKVVGTIAQNIKPGIGRYLWRVHTKLGDKSLRGDRYKILIMTKDRKTRDDSDHYFSIVTAQTSPPDTGGSSGQPEDQGQTSQTPDPQPYISVTEPIKNSGWCPNTAYTIKWESSLPTNLNVKIELVYRNETGYVPLRIITSSTPNDGTYQFNGLSESQVPVLSVGVSVKITVLDNSVYGVSGLIALGKQLKLMMSETDTWIWRHGTEYTLRWEQICDLPAPLNIELLDANHQPALAIATGLTPLANSNTVMKVKLYKWTVPLSLTPGDYYMRLSGGVVMHERPIKIDAPFVVPTSPEITLIRPIQNEGWCSDTAHTIEWTSNLLAGTHVKIDLVQSTSGGGFIVWRNITPDTTDTGAFTFNDPYPGAIAVRPRVSTLDDTISSIGDSFLFGTPLSLIKPNGIYTWRKGSNYFIIWKQVCDLSGSITLDLLDANQQHVMTIASGLSGNAKSDLLKQKGYMWTIPMNIAPGTYYIRVTGGPYSKQRSFNIGDPLN